VFDANGIDVEALAHHANEHGVVFGFPGAAAVSNAEVLECGCDALVLAAGERQVGNYNAAKVRARVLIELTQGVVTSGGAETLPSSCMHIPHLIAGAAELAVWDYEWRKGLTYSALDLGEAERRATVLALRAFDSGTAGRSNLQQDAIFTAVNKLATGLRT
jgi:glutamate dehydrogenase/leucine dehydrogenase